MAPDAPAMLTSLSCIGTSGKAHQSQEGQDTPTPFLSAHHRGCHWQKHR